MAGSISSAIRCASTLLALSLLVGAAEGLAAERRDSQHSEALKSLAARTHGDAGALSRRLSGPLGKLKRLPGKQADRAVAGEMDRLVQLWEERARRLSKIEGDLGKLANNPPKDDKRFEDDLFEVCETTETVILDNDYEGPGSKYFDKPDNNDPDLAYFLELIAELELHWGGGSVECLKAFQEALRQRGS